MLPNILYWVVLTSLATALMWIPPVINRFMVRGVDRTMGNPKSTDLPHAPWAERALAAHKNAVENLAVFAPLAVVSHFAAPNNAAAVSAAMVYFWARIAHYVIYTAGFPYFRTVAFGVGWLAILALGLGDLGALLAPARAP